MQRAEESESPPLTERSRGLFLNSYAVVSERELIEDKRLEEKYIKTRLDTNQPFEQIPQA